MSRRNRPEHRCERCRMHHDLCLCALLPRLETRTRVVLVVHCFDARKPSNTGRLAAQCLTSAELHIRGVPDEPEVTVEPEPGRRSLLLFPHPDAEPLTPDHGAGDPVTLVVPDGTWRQASKVRARVPGCSTLRCVSLPPLAPSRYRLRAEAHEHGLSTFEAIIRALGILEGPAIVDALEPVLLTMVERSLWARGTVARGDVTGGVPAGTMRHLPGRGRDVRAGPA